MKMQDGPAFNAEARFAFIKVVAIFVERRNSAEIVSTIQTIQREHFYKSMTANADHRYRQDVYPVPSPVGVLYVKFTADVVTGFLLLSFKRKNND